MLLSKKVLQLAGAKRVDSRQNQITAPSEIVTPILLLWAR
jgi:hypothetical protein